MYYINDIRTKKDFKNISFSNYKKSEVKKKINESIHSGKIEESCHWTAELICVANYEDIWDIIINYISRTIHIGNPKLPIYISLKISEFKKILEGGYLDNELMMRNNDQIKTLFAEINCILCLSKKKHNFEQIKISKNDFDLIQLTNKLHAPSTRFIEDYMKSDDPKELHMSVNEFIYHIQQKNNYMACFWIEWIIEFETMCKKKGDKIMGSTRTFAPIQQNNYKDIIWKKWEIILEESKKKQKMCKKIIKSLLNIFSIKYTNNSKKKRRYVLYFAISLLCENINYNIPIIEEKSKIQIQHVSKTIDVIYKEIKKNEISPKTDYLNTNEKKTNTEKSIEKLNLLYSN